MMHCATDVSSGTNRKQVTRMGRRKQAPVQEEEEQTSARSQSDLVVAMGWGAGPGGRDWGSGYPGGRTCGRFGVDFHAMAFV